MSDGAAAPIGAVEPGTTILVGSEDVDRAKQFALWLLLQGAGPEDAILFVNPDTPGEETFSLCGRIDPGFDAGEVRMIDCTGEPDPDPEPALDFGPEGDVDLGDGGSVFDLGIEQTDEEAPDAEYDAEVEYLPSADLTELGVKFSVMHENLTAGGFRRVLTGVNTVSSIVERTDLRTAVRFLKLISARVKNEGGLVVFVVDLSAHDDRTVATLAQVADGLIKVRATDDGDQIRMQGLPDQPEGWIPVPSLE